MVRTLFVEIVATLPGTTDSSKRGELSGTTDSSKRGAAYSNGTEVGAADSNSSTNGTDSGKNPRRQTGTAC